VFMYVQVYVYVYVCVCVCLHKSTGIGVCKGGPQRVTNIYLCVCVRVCVCACVCMHKSTGIGECKGGPEKFIETKPSTTSNFVLLPLQAQRDHESRPLVSTFCSAH